MKLLLLLVILAGCAPVEPSKPNYWNPNWRPIPYIRPPKVPYRGLIDAKFIIEKGKEMSKRRGIKKSKVPHSCYNCDNLGWRNYMTGPHSGGIDYWCNETEKDNDIDFPRDVVCDDWKKN